jgi:hypothetical protein
MRHIPHDHPDAALARPLRDLLARGASPLALAQELTAAVCAALGEPGDDPDTQLAVRTAITRVLAEAGA